MSRVAENVRHIFEQIDEFEQRYKRPSGSVTLLAVSKKQPVEKINLAYEAGVRHFGENYAQEAEEKIACLDKLDINWHFIGPIQANKTRIIANRFHWVHSVERTKIAQRLNDHRDAALPPLNVCIQINLSGETSKSGIRLNQLADLCKQIAALPRLRLRGLMAIPAAEIEFSRQRESFAKLALAFNSLSLTYPGFDTLSMGMSGDFEAAIAEGSTMIRIGTALFGSRI